MRARAGIAPLLCLVLGCSPEPASDTAPPPAADAPVAAVFAYYCSGCHAPPQRQVHSAVEWPGVVARMQDRRARAGLPAIPRAQAERIVSYLQGNQM